MYIDSLLYAVSVLLSLEVWLIIKVIKPTTLKKKRLAQSMKKREREELEIFASSLLMFTVWLHESDVHLQVLKAPSITFDFQLFKGAFFC